MQALVLFLIVVATTFRFLKDEDVLPRAAPYTLEVISALTLVIVIVVGVQQGFRYVRPAYWFAFGVASIAILCGIAVNQVDAGPIIAGARMYLRPIPFFFLPAVFLVKEKQLRWQLLLLLLICSIQLPLAYTQRMDRIAKGGATGDSTYGTLMISSILSIFLICAISVLLGMYLRRQLSLWKAGLLFFVFMLPTTLNETKGTLFLLPIAVITTFMTNARPGTRLKTLIGGVAVLAVFLAIFIPIYDRLIQVRAYPTTIAEFFTDENRIEAYVGTGDAQVGEDDAVGRADAILGTIRFMARDPIRLVFGVGMGNATESSLGREFTGRYFDLLEPFLYTTFTSLLTELGAFGLSLVLVLMWLVLQDSRYVAARGDGLVSALAAGWTGVVAVFVAGFLYKDLIPHESLSCLFWLFAGVIAAERMRIEHAMRAERVPAAGERRSGAR